MLLQLITLLMAASIIGVWDSPKWFWIVAVICVIITEIGEAIK